MRLVLGAANTLYHGWLSTDLMAHWSPNRLDVRRAEDWARYPGIEMALAEHVWEHLTPEEGRLAARLCGQHVPRIRVAVPDGLFPDAGYVARARLGECPGDHLGLYDYRSLAAVFRQAGYKVTLLEWWDAEGVFHYRPWSPDQGMVNRSLRYDRRNQAGKLGYTSLILDAERVS